MSAFQKLALLALVPIVQGSPSPTPPSSTTVAYDTYCSNATNPHTFSSDDTFRELIFDDKQYLPNQECHWLITNNKPLDETLGCSRQRIRFHLVNFDSEYIYDYALAFDGSSTFAPRLASFSGSYVMGADQAISTTGRDLLFYFSSDYADGSPLLSCVL